MAIRKQWRKVNAFMAAEVQPGSGNQRVRRALLGSMVILPGALILGIYAVLLVWTVNRSAGGWREADPRTAFLIEDRDSPLKAAEVLAGRWDGEFRPLAQFGGRLHGRNRGAYWLRIELKPEDLGADGQTFLQFDEGSSVWTLRELRLFASREGATAIATTGYEVPRKERTWREPGFILPVPADVAAKGVLYLHARTHQKFKPSFVLWPSATAAAFLSGRLDGMFYTNCGVIIALFLVHCVIFVGLRRRYEVYYLVFLVFTLSYATVLHYGQKGLWPWHNEDGFVEPLVFFVSCAYLSLIWFSRHFLELPKRLPRFDRVLCGVALLHVVMLVVARFTSDDFGWSAFALLGISKNILTNLLLLLASLLAWRQGAEHARLHFLAFGVFLSFSTYQHAVRFGVMTALPFPYGGLDLNFLVTASQAVILNFAIADRIGGIIRSRDAARRDAIHHLRALHELESETKENLAREVAAKTRDLQAEVRRTQETEAALAEALERAADASRSKSEFLASMSHELRTPLNAILGYAQILQRNDSTTAKSGQAAAIIQRSGEHLLTLINDILDLSRVEAGKLEIAGGEFLLSDLVTQLSDMMSIRAREKKLEIESAIAPELRLPVWGDERRVRQVLVNLLGNAVKFTESGFVHVAAARDPGHPERVFFTIEDSGPGVPEVQRERIFEPFRQIFPNSKTHEGTGLGLAISRKLARLMGGDITVENRPGGGAIFRLALKLPIASSTTASTAARERPTGYEGAQKRILVADDRQDNRDVVVQMLSALGFEVAEATDGRDAIEQALNFIPDLLIIDLVMPVMDGFEAVRRLRQISRLEGLKIVASSASVFEHNRAESLAVGCNDFLPKPIQEADLVAVVGRQLGLRWRYAGPPPSDGSAKVGAEAGELSLEGVLRLRHAARRGDIIAGRRELEALMTSPSKQQAFLERVKVALDEFDPDCIVSLIDEMFPQLTTSGHGH